MKEKPMQTFFTARKKMIVLLIIMLFGFGFLANMLLKNQKTMQHQLDTLYFGTFIPVSNLKEIVIELERIQTVLYQNKPPRAYSAVQESDVRVKNLWESYATSYKTAEEQIVIDQVQHTMVPFYLLLQAVTHSTQPLAPKEQTDVIQAINEVTQKISQLIDYETQQAALERKSSLAAYDETKKFFLSAIGLLIIGGLALYIPIMQSISRYEKELKTLAFQLHHASITDGLTGLFNRRYFDRICDKELSRAKREGLSVTLMMIDIDYFKPYNDRYGHPAGDEIIKKVARYLQEHFKRPYDLIFRLGGEEFGVLLIGTPTDAAIMMAQSTVTGMEKLSITHEASPIKPYVTLSMGMIHAPAAQIQDAIHLYHDTDQKLYQAKTTGRNQVVWGAV